MGICKWWEFCENAGEHADGARAGARYKGASGMSSQHVVIPTPSFSIFSLSRLPSFRASLPARHVHCAREHNLPMLPISSSRLPSST